LRRVPAVLAALLLLAACHRRPSEPTIVLDKAAVSVEARGLDGAALKALARLPDAADAWAPVFSVSTRPGLPPVTGTYAVKGGVVRFTPAFPLEPGRTYLARLDLSGMGGPAPITTRLTATAAPSGQPATVTAVYPSGPVWPQNLLRLYVQFSAPMAVGGAGPLSLLDDRGRPLDEPFLPLGYEFWSPDHTRLTLLMDPGRVKRGVIADPILKTGGRYTLLVGAGWRDARGAPTTSAFRRTVSVGPPVRQALDLKAWTLTAPKAGARAPLRIVFDHPLDRGLLLSALGLADADGRALPGQAQVEAGETAWSFTPLRPWAAQSYRLKVLPWLEDAAGNRPSRPFEGHASVVADPRHPLEIPFHPQP